MPGLPLRYQKAIDHIVRILLSPRGFFTIVAVYLLLLYVIRTVAFPGGSVDDAEALFYAQAFRWGTMDDHPPLPHWLNLWSESLLGAGVPAVMAVKFLSFFATYAFMFLAGREALRDDRLACVSALSLVSFFVFAWEAVLDFLHVVVLAPTIPATLYALLLLERRPGITVYAGLGLAVGAGFLSKYGYALFFLPMVIAALADPVLRGRLLTRRSLVTVAIVAVMMAPHLIWKMEYPPAANADDWYVSAGSGVSAAVSGVLSAGWQALVFLSPFVFLFAALFPRAFLPLRQDAGGARAVRHRRLFERFFALFAVLLIAVVIGFGMASVRTHWMMVLIPTPIYGFLRVQATEGDGGSGERIAWFTAVLAVLAVAVVIAIGPRWLMGPWVCNKCTFFVPYAELAHQVQDAGFRGGTVIAADYPVPIGPNLRRFFPDARVISTRYASYRPPLVTALEPDCLLIWNQDQENSAEQAVALAGRRLGVEVPADARRQVIQAPIRRSGGRMARFGLILLPGACG